MLSTASPAAAVCVPVRNEAVLLPRLLDALAAQQGAGDFVLCLLLDGCSDASAAIVADRAASLPFAVVSVAVAAGPPNAGLARRRAMQLGLGVLDDAAMILSTDADSVPAPEWLFANAAALAVADVAAGRIVRAGGRASPVQDRVEAYYDALFALRRAIDPVPWEAPRTHHYTSAASLAMRAATYRALGGFPSIPAAEDARLVDAAHRDGLRVRHDAAIRVETSARREGRAAGGLADHLRRLDGIDSDATMAHPGDMVWRYERQAAARAAWDDLAADGASLATLLGCGADHVARVAADSVNAEAFAMRVVPDVPGGERLVSLAEAEAALDRLRGARASA